jgi:hemerythrin-like domain-containing protein
MDILKRLDTDHRNVSQLLDFLEAQLAGARGKPADFELMRDVMQYMTHYPDRVHHPLEDLVIERLIEQDPSAQDICESTLREHEDLARKSEAFLEMLIQATGGEMLPGEEIEATGRDYIGFLRAHMEKEDKRLFPLAKETLTAQDWYEISKRRKQLADPVFGAVVQSQFRQLHARIQR